MGPNDRFPDGLLITISGIILFLLTFSLIGPTVRLVHNILDMLKRVEERPGPAVAVTMLLLGTLVISAMGASSTMPGTGSRMRFR